MTFSIHLLSAVPREPQRTQRRKNETEPRHPIRLDQADDRGGLIEEVSGRPAADDERRRYYRITREGREAARQEMARMSALLNNARRTSLRSNEG
jgi:hypothetical protein